MFKKWTVFFLLLSSIASATVTNNGLYDYQGKPLTTNQSTGTRNALDTETIIGGSIIDPRSRTWSLSSGTDSASCTQGTSPWVISGTVTANQGSPPWSVLLTDGTNNPTLKALNNQVVATDYGYVSNTVIHGLTTGGGGGYIDVKVNPSGALTVDSTQSGIWTVQQGTPPWSLVGNVASGATDSGNPLKTGAIFNTTQPTITNGQRVDAQATNRGELLVSPGTSGFTVTANAGTNLNTSLLATSSNQTNGSQKTQVVDGSNNTVGPVQTISGTNYQPVVLASSITPGTAVPSRSIEIAGSDGTNAQNISTDTTGKLNINNLSGTVTLPTGASTSSNQTNGTQKTQVVDGSGNVQPSGDVASRKIFTALTDGTNTATVKAASTAPVSTDTSVVTAINPNSTLPSGTNLLGKVGIDQTTPGTTNLVANTPVDGYKQTYTAAILGLSAAATTPTDVFTITGSGTKTIRILRFAVSAIAGSAATKDIQIVKRSTADTGGTSASVTAVPHDSNNAAATATVLSYTANPTLGTLVGPIATSKIGMPPNNNGSADKWLVEFGNNPGQAIVLRGTSQVVAVNMNAVTTNTLSLDIYVTWTEE